MKKIASFLALIILLSVFVIADFDLRKGYSWLIARGDQGNYNNDVVNSALAAIALKNYDVDEALEAISWLKSNKNANNCWPKTSCRVKDTAFAIWALNEFEENIGESIDWLNNAETASTFGGRWLLQVATTGSGSCNIRYRKGNVEMERTIEVEEGKFPSCGNSNWFDLNSCLEVGLLTSYSSLELDIDCTRISSGTIISLLFNSGNSYYIVDEVHSNQATIIVQNSCYGIGYRGGCNYESTLYTNWILKKLNRETKSLFYLKQNYDKNNVVHNSLLYSISGEEKYLEELRNLRRRDGSWNNNVYSTAIALMAIRDESNATDWLKERQRSDGSWNGNVVDTAMVLINAFVGEDISGCIGDECEDFEGGVCDYDDVCEASRGEDEDNCPDDCKVEERYKDEEPGVCNYNGICERAYEDYYNCPDDCPYEEEDYGDGGGEEVSYPEEVEKEGFPWSIILMLLILLIIGIGGYIYYTRFYVKRGKEDKSKPSYGSFLTRNRESKTELDKNLEKSIGDLRRLVKR